MSTAFTTHELLRHDYLRGSPWARGGRGRHKEWLHFCVFGDGFDLLVNFSLSDDTGPTAARGTQLARLTVLTCVGGTWDGDVDTFEPDDVHAVVGQVDLRFGSNVCRLRDGAYHVRFALAERPVVGDLVLTPATTPLRAPSIPQLDGPPLHWVTMPRVFATGTVSIAGRTHRVERALAYHDHNWGHFVWGNDMSWRWGFGVPREGVGPWSFAFARITDRARHHAVSSGLFVWRDERLVAAFRDHALDIETSGRFLGQRGALKIPRVMALISPEDATEVPRTMDLVGRGGGDEIHCRFEADSVGQVVVPAEQRLGVTIINEVSGRTAVHGTIGGEALAIDCRSVFEFLVT
jgi:hypothetical protein